MMSFSRVEFATNCRFQTVQLFHFQVFLVVAIVVVVVVNVVVIVVVVVVDIFDVVLLLITPTSFFERRQKVLASLKVS